MNTRILLVGHGSRNHQGNEEIERFTALWRERHPSPATGLCFIEFAEPGLTEGLDRAATGADQVVVAPLILSAAGHVRHEIPAAIDQARRRHPGVDFRYAAALGAAPPLLRVLERRLRHAMHTLAMPDPRTTGVILLGRGSSDTGANGELAKMARWLQEQGEHELVEIAFTGITHPRLERVVERQAHLGMGQIVILPWYLFTGTLMNRIQAQLERLRLRHPRIAFALADYLGFEEEVFDLLRQRIDQARTGEIPAPAVPAPAHSGHHHHHHHHD